MSANSTFENVFSGNNQTFQKKTLHFNHFCIPVDTPGLHLEWLEFLTCIAISLAIGCCLGIWSSELKRIFQKFWNERFELLISLLKVIDICINDGLTSFHESLMDEKIMLELPLMSNNFMHKYPYSEFKNMPPPPRFVRGCCGNDLKARARWLKTLEWRKINNVDKILSEPFPQYEIIKKHFPAFIYGRSKQRNVVLYEKLGKVDIKAIRDEGITLSMLLKFYILRMEYIWNIVERSDDAQLVVIQDLDGLLLKDLNGFALDFIKNATFIAGKHYVERSYKNFIINTPKWFGILWTILTPFIDIRTKKKVCILDSQYKEYLIEVISPKNIPFCYGGTCQIPLADSKYEKELSSLVAVNNKKIKDFQSMKKSRSNSEVTETLEFEFFNDRKQRGSSQSTDEISSSPTCQFTSSDNKNYSEDLIQDFFKNCEKLFYSTQSKLIKTFRSSKTSRCS